MVADCVLEYMTDHFFPRQWYRGDGHWTWWMQREVWQVKGRGGYIIGTIRNRFFNAEVR